MRKPSIMIILIFLGILPLFGETQYNIDEQLKDEYETVNTELDNLYNLILEEYSNDLVFIEKFQMAQNNWILFRDSHVDSLFPEEDKRFKYGSAYIMCYMIEMIQLTQQRIDQLDRWLQGVEDGELCRGSIKRK